MNESAPTILGNTEAALKVRPKGRTKFEKAIHEYMEWLLDDALQQGVTPITFLDWVTFADYGDCDGYGEVRSTYDFCQEASRNGNFYYYDEDLIEHLLTKKQAQAEQYTDSDYLIDLQATALYMACLRLSRITEREARRF